MGTFKPPVLNNDREFTKCGIRLKKYPFRSESVYGEAETKPIVAYNVQQFFSRLGKKIEAEVGPAPQLTFMGDREGRIYDFSSPNDLGQGIQGLVFRQDLTNPRVCAQLGLPVGATGVGKLTDAVDEIEFSQFLLKQQSQANYNFSRPTPSMMPKIGKIIVDDACNLPNQAAAYIVREDIQNIENLHNVVQAGVSVRLQDLVTDCDILNTVDYFDPDSRFKAPIPIDLAARLTERTEQVARYRLALNSLPIGRSLVQATGVQPISSVSMGFVNQRLESETQRAELKVVLDTAYQFYLDMYDFINYTFNHSILVTDIHDNNIGFTLEDLPTYGYRESDNRTNNLIVTPNRRQRIRFVVRDLGLLRRLTRPKNAAPPEGSALLFGTRWSRR